MEIAPLELNLPEAIALAFQIHMPGAMRLRIYLFDAILALESGVGSPYSVPVSEAECWIIDAFIREDSKDLSGNSLRPLLRRVWKLIIAWHEDELVQAPEMPSVQASDRSWKEILDAYRKANSDAGDAADTGTAV